MRPSPHGQVIRKALIIVALALFGLSLTPRTALAQTIIRGDRVYSGEVIDNDVIMYGDDVQLAGTVIGNAFILGRDVTVEGTVQGSLFVIGQRVTINGTVDGSAYVIGVTARLGSTASIGQNLYFTGVSLMTDRTSQVGRDLNGVSLGAVLQGSVGRDTRLIAGLVQFLSLFMDTALGPAPGPLRLARLSQRAPGLGQFLLPGDIVIDVLGRTSGATQTEEVTKSQSELVADWFRLRLRDFLPLLTIGLIAYWFFRQRLEETSTVMRTRPLRALGVGLIGLILSGAVLGAFVLVFVLVLMTGIWLGTINLWNMSWLFWSVAFPFTALAMSLFLVFLNYGTKAILAFAAASYIISRSRSQNGRWRWVLFVLGLAIFVLLRAIPILGWVIGVVATAWGIGAAWLAWRARRDPVALPDLPGTPVVESPAPVIEDMDAVKSPEVRLTDLAGADTSRE